MSEREPQKSGGVSNFLIGAIIGGLSVLVVVLAYQLYLAQQANKTTNATQNGTVPSTTPVPISTPNVSPPGSNEVSNPATVNPFPSASPTNTPSFQPQENLSTNSLIQPGQFVSPVSTRTGEVELVSVQRTQNPKTGKRDAVLIKMQVRRTDYSKNDNSKHWTFATWNTSIVNPETQEDYTVRDGTGLVNLLTIDRGTTAGAFIRTEIPENVSTIDIYIKYVEAFKNVPIAQ